VCCKADVVEQGIVLGVVAHSLPVAINGLLVLPRLEGIIALLTQPISLSLLVYSMGVVMMGVRCNTDCNARNATHYTLWTV
jgi:hypothetical protein